MKYFLLKQDTQFTTSPDIQNWFQYFDKRNIKRGYSHKIPSRQLMFISENKNTIFTDVISFPYFLVRETLCNVIKMYEPTTIFKQIVLLDRKNAKTCIYYLPILPHIDCLAEDSKLTLDRSTIIEAVINPHKIQDHSIFYLETAGNQYTVVRLDILESFLRRGAIGLGLEEIKLAH